MPRLEPRVGKRRVPRVRELDGPRVGIESHVAREGAKVLERVSRSAADVHDCAGSGELGEQSSEQSLLVMHHPSPGRRPIPCLVVAGGGDREGGEGLTPCSARAPPVVSHTGH